MPTKKVVSVQKTTEHWIVTERLIVKGRTLPTIYLFPEMTDGCVLIPICQCNIVSSQCVKIRNARLQAEDGEVFVESTKNPSLKAKLSDFCHSWYRQWVLKGEGELVEE